MLRVRVCGGLEIEAGGRVVEDALAGGRQGRLVFAYLLCERHRAVRREELADLLWGEELPDSWSASLSAVVSRLRRLLTAAGVDGSEAIVSASGAYQLVLPADAVVDLDELDAAVSHAEAAAAASDVDGALVAAAVAEAIGERGFLLDESDWVDRQRDAIRDLRVRAMSARAAAHLGSASPTRAVEAARSALALDPLREASYRALMQALAAGGERAEALRVWEHCRTTLVEELGVDPSPETEAVYLEVLGHAAPAEPPPPTALPSGVVTFLLTDIVGSAMLWDASPEAMAVALERHDSLVADVVTGHGGTFLKSKLEGDATVSVFHRASDGATAALALQDALATADWPDGVRPRLRMAVHTGEAFERGGDYFGPALNRAARLRAMAGPDEVLLSQSVTELVRDNLSPRASLDDLGSRDLRGLSRSENVFRLRRSDAPPEAATPPPERPAEAFVPPALPDALRASTPFVGRSEELGSLLAAWRQVQDGAPGAVFIGGEPGVGKSRLAAEVAAVAHAAGGIVLYGRCDEDLSAPLQPFIEALGRLVPALGPTRTRAVRGVHELAGHVPELAEQLGEGARAARADAQSERLVLFDGVTNLIHGAALQAPVLLVLDDLHWAGKTTLSLLRHLLRRAETTPLLVVGTYRSTELARTHPLSDTLADLRREAYATRMLLGGLSAADVDVYLSAVGVHDAALGRRLAELTSGNPFFLAEVLRHVEDSGGAWSTDSLPEGVREVTGHRLSRLSDRTNRALSVAAVVGMSFDLALVEEVEQAELVDEISEACRAGLVIEEDGSVDRFRFTHALIRQVLLAELVTVKRLRLHKAIAELLEGSPEHGGADTHLIDLAHHWYECAALGFAGRAVDACRRAGDRAVERLAYEEAGDLYARAIQILDDDADPDGTVRASLLLARCDALLTAGDVADAREAIDALEAAAQGSERLSAWYTTYEGQLAVLAEPDRLDEIVRSIAAAATAMRALGDLPGEARAHFVHASALERLGRMGAAEQALDAALSAAREAHDRRLGDSILAAAPPAALWGPRSIAQASGRCLDVVRVRRSSDGAPAVECVALRCQAVLEGLRGRTAQARRLVASARRKAERLALTHRLLETDVAAGSIELLAGDASAAEGLLRGAYEGLRERGLGGEAAQAAAVLGRALLLQGRLDEADVAAAGAETLAGSDLRAGVAWRGVRAEVAAHRGDTASALALAREAVDLASSTDALLLVIDARLALTAVFRAIGDDPAADDAARSAIEACEAKGATALLPHIDVATPRPGEPMTGPESTLNRAVTVAHRIRDAINRGTLADAIAGSHPDLRIVDRRSQREPDRSADHLILSPTGAEAAYEVRTRVSTPEPLVTRGDSAALVRFISRGVGVEPETLLVVARVDDDGLLTDWIVFDAMDRAAANEELERLAPAADEHDTAAWRAAARNAVAANAHDWVGFVATLAPDYHMADRRPLVPHVDAALDEHRTMFDLDDFAYERVAVDFAGDRRVLCRDVIWIRDGVVGDAEVVSYTLLEVDDRDRIIRNTGFGPALEDARAALHADVPEPHPRPNAAWRAVRRMRAAQNERRSWDDLVAHFAPDFEFHDRRAGLRVHEVGDAALGIFRTMFLLDEWSYDETLVATRGEDLVLTSGRATFTDREAGPAEVPIVAMTETSPDGLIRRMTALDDVASGLEAVDRADTALRTSGSGAIGNAAWQLSLRQQSASDDADWAAFAATFHPSYEYVGRLVARWPGELPLVVHRGLFELDEWKLDRSSIATRGERLALVHQSVWFRDGVVGPAEFSSLALLEVADDGRLVREEHFEPSVIDEAVAELDRRSALIGESLHVEPTVPSPLVNAAWRAALRMRAGSTERTSWDQIVTTVTTDFEYADNRSGVRIHERGEAALDVLFGTIFRLDEYTWEGTLVATRGEHLALVRDHSTFIDGDAGPAEVLSLSVIEATVAGRVQGVTVYDVDDLDAAVNELDRLAAARAGGSATALSAVWELSRRQEAASATGDWEAFEATFHPSCEYVERRPGVWQTDASPLAVYRDMFALDQWEFQRTLISTRGDRLALVHQVCRFRDGEAGPAESAAIAVLEVAEDGRLVCEVDFDPDATDEATAELDQRWNLIQGATPTTA